MAVQRNPSVLPRPRWEPGTAERMARSVAARGDERTVRETADWVAGRAASEGFRVEPIPLAGLDGWRFDERTGNLAHHSGRFFTVEGLHVTVRNGPFPEWCQPVIHQPEVGILGILAKEFDGVLHFLMQAKMEPGNPNLVQLSPTVQATYSNYTGAHRGRKVHHIDYFVQPGRGRVLVDVLQSEHGAWFYRKSNRNMIVEVTEDVAPHEDFRWLTLGQIGRLLRRDNLVNMDSRTVLSCAPVPEDGTEALHTDTELLSWLTGERTRYGVTARRVPLASVPDWEREEYAIRHREDRYFRVVAVAVEAGTREVGRWTQPLFEPYRRGVIAFLTRRLGGVPHVLVHARVEGGLPGLVELAPTVQCDPGNYAHLPPGRRPPFLDVVLSAPPGRVRYEAVHSEEGGRFRGAENRVMVVEADEDEDEAPLSPPPGYRWVTPGQLRALVRHGHYLNVQARTLLACLNTGAAVL